jgi:hypothetical protein
MSYRELCYQFIEAYSEYFINELNEDPFKLVYADELMVKLGLVTRNMITRYDRDEAIRQWRD